MAKVLLEQDKPVDLIAKSMLITKAYTREDGTIGIEGWTSTNDPDMERDVIEPESFGGIALTDYFQHGAPVSTEHDTDSYPVGHLLKSVLIRDGKIFQEEVNPHHERENFQFLTDSLTRKGTGWYSLGVIDEPKAIKQIAKRRVSSFSFIGMPKEWENLPNGGRHFKKASSINPLIEVTVSAYPINRNAMFRIAKARGYVGTQKYQIDLQDLVNSVVEMQRSKIRSLVESELDKGKH